MIKEVNHVCEKLNTKLGISVSLPNPKKETLKAASVCNFVAGAGLVAAGVMFPSKLCAVLGGVSILSGIALRRESGGGNEP